MSAPDAATVGAIRRFFDWAVCGYGDKTLYSCFWRGFRIGMGTRRGRLVHWLLDLHWSVSHVPQSFRWWLADQLMRGAMRLRGQRVTTLGYYDDMRGNMQAKLMERVEFKCLANLDTETFVELQDTFDELASLCGAISWRHK